MRTRQLGQSELHLSTVGFGAWAVGGGDWAYGWGPQDDAESVRAIRRALDLGVNWIDTAAVYGLGHSEEVVARAIQGITDVTVATKCSLRWRSDRSIYSSLRAASVRQEVEGSLRRLRREVIDLYQIHWPNPAPEVEEGWATLSDLVGEGKIRYAGVSNFSLDQMQRCQAIHPITSLQPPYNMIDRAVEQRILPFCAEHHVGVVAYSPMQCGLLTGAFSRGRVAALDPSDWRRRDRAFREPILGKALELVERLRPVAGRLRLTLSQLAIAWVLRRPVVTSAIVGARSPAQIDETAHAGDVELAAADAEEVEAILEEVAVPQPGPLA